MIKRISLKEQTDATCAATFVNNRRNSVSKSRDAISK